MHKSGNIQTYLSLKMVDIDHFDLIGNDDKTIMLEY